MGTSKTISIDHPCSPERITNIYWWTDALLSFRVTRPLALKYLPGQYARIALQLGNQLIWRPFSFVSSPNEDLLEFLAVLVPGGLFTNQLRLAEPGDTLWVEHENYGFMTPDRFEDGHDLWLLATGTGVGAFLSVLRSTEVWDRFQRIILVHGVRTREQLVYQEELHAMQRSAKENARGAMLTLVACLSGEGLNGEGTGRSVITGDSGVQYVFTRTSTALDSGQLEAATGRPVTPAFSRVMLCGNPGMIDDLRKQLHARGMTPCRKHTPGQFLTENYW